jgi:dTDP-glucose 4,6-dehydratase
MHILVTGGLGFIGSNFIRKVLLTRPSWRITNLDKMTYAGNPASLQDVSSNPAYRFLKGDICDRALMAEILTSRPDAIVHFAAESHVDRSIHGPEIFVQTNVLGTQVLLEQARQAKVPRFLHVSTDEVYGSLGPTGLFSETTPISPNSPYSASKAGSDLLVAAYHHTYGMDTVITRCSNNYGPYQYPEKLIPLLITNLMDGLQIPIYGDGKNVRDWIHVDDHCAGILAVLEKGRPGQAYNLGGGNERENIEIAKLLLGLLGKGEDAIRYVEDRLGHDRRYAIDATKARVELGWEPKTPFQAGLAGTVEWYKANEKWWRPLKTPPATAKK